MRTKVVFGWGLDRLEAKRREGGRVGFRLFVTGRIEGEFDLSTEDLRRLLDERTDAAAGDHRLSSGRSLWYVFESETGNKVRMEIDRFGLEKLAGPLLVANA